MMHRKTPVKYRKFSKISIIQCLFTVGLSVIDWPESVYVVNAILIGGPGQILSGLDPLEVILAISITSYIEAK
jgi:hypothetical protein